MLPESIDNPKNNIESGLSAIQAYDISRALFTVPVGPENERRNTVWTVLSEVADSIGREARQEPAASFALSEEENFRMSMPFLRSFPEAAKNITGFKHLIELYGQAAGFIPLSGQDIPSLHTVYQKLHFGQNTVDALSKTLRIAARFYQEHSDMALVQPAEEILGKISLLYDYFQPNKLLGSEIFGSLQPPIGLTYLNEDIRRRMKAIMERDPGKIRLQFTNSNCRLDFHENGTVRVTIDRRTEDAASAEERNHQLWDNYSDTMYHAGVMTNAGVFANGQINTYTIPAGADTEAVLRGLLRAEFIDEEEKSRLTKLLNTPHLPAGPASDIP